MKKKFYSRDAVKITRAVIGDKALYIHSIFKHMKKALGQKKAEKILRQAIYDVGVGMSKKLDIKSPQDWINIHNKFINHQVFSSKTSIKGGRAEQRFFYCPLVTAWKKAGCSKKEIALLCDIASELDIGSADGAGIKIDIPKKLAKGDRFCHFILNEGD